MGDHSHFSINGTSGAVTLTADPNYEGKNSYAFTVIATDSLGNDAEQAVTLAINNRDEVAPAFTSGTTGNANENQAALYSATSTVGVDVMNVIGAKSFNGS